MTQQNLYPERRRHVTLHVTRSCQACYSFLGVFDEFYLSVSVRAFWNGQLNRFFPCPLIFIVIKHWHILFVCLRLSGLHWDTKLGEDLCRTIANARCSFNSNSFRMQRAFSCRFSLPAFITMMSVLGSLSSLKRSEINI